MISQNQPRIARYEGELTRAPVRYTSNSDDECCTGYRVVDSYLPSQKRNKGDLASSAECTVGSNNRNDEGDDSVG